MKAKSIFFVFSLFLFCEEGITQTLTLGFTGQNNGQFVPLDKIVIENLDKGCDTTLFYPVSTIVLQILGIEDPGGSSAGLTLFQNSPNPVIETTSVKIFNPAPEYVSVVVLDVSGKQLCSYHEKLDRGYHIFDFTPGHHGTFIFSVSTSELTRNIKVTSTVSNENGTFCLQYSGKTDHEKIVKMAASGFIFSTGDHLRYTGYYNSMTKVIEDTPNNNKTYAFYFSNSGFICGQSLTINHVAGNVAPVTKSTTYGTVTNIPGETAKCWITSNLGSDHQATAVDDATEASAGWYWQFNRKQGYKHDGSTLTPGWTITSINENSDWQTANNPCTLELGAAWRLPTYTEWCNVDNVGYWTTWTGPWNSSLKLHAAGFISRNYAVLFYRGSDSYYWSSTQYSTDCGWYLFFGSGYSEMIYSLKAYGNAVRCIKD